MSDGDIGPKPIGIDLGELGKVGPRMRDDRCPGALLVITRYDFDQLVDGGEMFATPRREMTADGKGEARVHCTNSVMRKASSLGGEVTYGLCLSCSGLEADVRQQNRERQGQQR